MNKKIAAAWILAAASAAGWALLAAQAFGGFRFDGPLSRVITPNGDGINDIAVICFDNPSDSDVAGKVYTLWGAQVADLLPRQSATATSCPAGNSRVPGKTQHMDWDPRSQGQRRGGVYVYRVQAEGMTFVGTLMVVK